MGRQEQRPSRRTNASGEVDCPITRATIYKMLSLVIFVVVAWVVATVTHGQDLVAEEFESSEVSAEFAGKDPNVCVLLKVDQDRLRLPIQVRVFHPYAVALGRFDFVEDFRFPKEGDTSAKKGLLIRGLKRGSPVGVMIFPPPSLAEAFAPVSLQIVPDPSTLTAEGGPCNALPIAHFTLGTTRPGEAEVTGAPRDGGSLRFFANDEEQGKAYYRAVQGSTDETGDRGTLQKFRSANGFVSATGRLETAVVDSAIYFNAGDLGLARSMHMRITTRFELALRRIFFSLGVPNFFLPGLRLGRADSNIAYYVSNFSTVKDAIDAFEEEKRSGAMGSPLATVAMEYSVTPGLNDNQPFTKFFIYDAAGKIIPGVDLDGRGLTRFVPNLCVVCHGSRPFSPTPAQLGDLPTLKMLASRLDGKFIPFDVESFGFANLRGYRKDEQQLTFFNLNHGILSTNVPPATAALIKQWYPKGTIAQYSAAIPPEWARDQDSKDLYNHVFKRSCRSCHLQVGLRPLRFEDAQTFRIFAGVFPERICRANVFADFHQPDLKFPDMPHARWTFLNFWLNSSPAKGELWHQPAVLAESILKDKDAVFPGFRAAWQRCTPRPKITGRVGDIDGDGVVNERDIQLLGDALRDPVRAGLDPTGAVRTYPDPRDLVGRGTDVPDGMVTREDLDNLFTRCSDRPCRRVVP